MPQIAREVRTIMYSVEATGHVAVHRFPWDANDAYSAEKFEKLKRRGFTFADPRQPGGLGVPVVIVTEVVDLSKPILVEQANEPELEVLAEVETQNIKPEEVLPAPPTPAEILKLRRQEQMAKARAAKKTKRVKI